ncbi:GNAT family N-acetyltransferase [Pseudarthrobacter sp. L19]|uniref:GNAT family N-acetyltransferase n=1 Tax=Pseudarthrobacter sp. L19 TaxID=3423951 RepID=UPI003D7BA8E3
MMSHDDSDDVDARQALDGRLSWRPAGPGDLDAWAALIARTAAVEHPVWYERREDLAQILSSRQNPAAANTILGFDVQGTARAYGRLTKNNDGDKALGFGCVDPDWQGSGVGGSVLAWLEERTRQRFADDADTDADVASRTPGRAGPRLRLHSEEAHHRQAWLFERHGYRVVRYYNEMHRPLTDPLPGYRLDGGLELADFGPALHEEVRQAHNDAFRDHWGSEPRDEEAWGFVVNDPLARPDLSCVVLDTANGRVAGYQLASHDPDIAVERGSTEGYTDLLGVRREYRGRGVARALLAEAMRRFAAAGMDKASLDVDSENPTGALALYTALGYRTVNRSMAWDKEL